jgi:hypothetical protein
LRDELLNSLDGTSNQVGEEGYKRRKVDDALERFLNASIHIDDVGHRLEHIKGDSQRKYDVSQIQTSGPDRV